MQDGEQEIFLDRAGCAEVKGIVIHEILHAIGFHHMQAHTDRDKYIKIYWENIDTSYESEYLAVDAKETSSFDTSYDFYSIMHYPPFSSDGDRVIKPRSKYSYYEQFMGQRVRLSMGDIDRINNMYKCEKVKKFRPKTTKKPKNFPGGNVFSFRFPRNYYSSYNYHF